MNEKDYGNEPIKDQKEVDMIFKVYEESGVLHYQDMMKLKAYLTPPTSNDVCKALSEHYHIDVEYDSRYKTFESEKTWYACGDNDVIDFGGDKLPYDIALMVIKFF